MKRSERVAKVVKAGVEKAKELTDVIKKNYVPTNVKDIPKKVDNAIQDTWVYHSPYPTRPVSNCLEITNKHYGLLKKILYGFYNKMCDENIFMDYLIGKK